MKHSFYRFLGGILLLAIVAAWSRPLPKLFLIGDSISIQYGPYLEKYLGNVVSFERKQDDGQATKNLDVPAGANGGDSRMVLAYLTSKLKDPDFRPDFLVLNCGLHDIKRNPSTGAIQVNETDYRSNLGSIVKLLKKQRIKMIWIRTTPVVDRIHNAKSRSFHRFAADVDTYNRIADEICLKNRIPAIDLFDFSIKLGEEQIADHVHYKEPARALQAAFIAGSIRSLLNFGKN